MPSKTASNAKNGPAAAALLAGGIAAVFYGIIIIFSGGITAVGNALNWYNPSGSLSGKTGVTVIVWLVLWAILGNQWKDREVDFEKTSNTALALLVAGVVLTLPPVFDFFIHLIIGK